MSSSMVLRQNPNITVTANDAGLLFATDNGWTVAMLAQDAVAYVASQDRKDIHDPQRGFFKHPTGVVENSTFVYVLSHNGARLPLTEDDVTRLMGFIRSSAARWQ